MADQASVRGATPEAANGSGGGVVGSIADFGNDVATLVEPQAKLAALDAKECTTKAVAPVAVIAVSVAVVLATVPVALLGVADVLARVLGILPGWAMLITAAVALALAGLVLLLSVREMLKSLEPLRRSREELVRNLAWLRTVMVYSGRAFPRRGL